LPTDRLSICCRERAVAWTSSTVAGVLTCALLLSGALAFAPAHSQAVTAQGATNGNSAAAAKAPTVSRPLWNELSPAQQKSLSPLAPHWNGLHAAQKRKWIALSRNFDSMSPDDQALLHSRMTEWAALSPQDRTRARLNFAEVKRLAPQEERKAKWEAYQALSDEERRKLAERAGSRPPSAAAPVRPVPAQKLAPTPSVAASSSKPHPPRIQLAPPAASSSAPSSAPASATPAALKPVEAP
jgi:hypothetical protein